MSELFIKEWRIAKGLTQEQLGEMIGVTKGRISELERGVRRYNLDMIIAFSRAFSTRPENLFKHPDDQSAASVLDQIDGWSTLSAETRSRIMAFIEMIVELPETAIPLFIDAAMITRQVYTNLSRDAGLLQSEQGVTGETDFLKLEEE